MINRFKRIHSEFGTSALLRTLLLLVGLAITSTMGILMFGRFDAAIISVVGLAAGAMFRNTIGNYVGSLSIVTNVGLFIYGLVLFLGDRIGMDNSIKLAIITLTTVLVFDLQFWSLSDPEVYNSKRERV